MVVKRMNMFTGVKEGTFQGLFQTFYVASLQSYMQVAVLRGVFFPFPCHRFSLSRGSPRTPQRTCDLYVHAALRRGAGRPRAAAASCACAPGRAAMPACGRAELAAPTGFADDVQMLII